MREVDGIKVAFVGEESYFESLFTPSMFSTARDTGADVVILLAAGKQEADLTDDDIRAALEPVAWRFRYADSKRWTYQEDRPAEPRNNPGGKVIEPLFGRPVPDGYVSLSDLRARRTPEQQAKVDEARTTLRDRGEEPDAYRTLP